MSEFSVGDIVKLKSGGPEMVVSHVLDSDNAMKNAVLGNSPGLGRGDLVCTWFEGEEKKESGFRADTVTRVNGEDG